MNWSNALPTVHQNAHTRSNVLQVRNTSMKTQTIIEMGNGQNVAVGDIFVSSWGYDQTNVDFSKVIAFSASGKSAKIVSIGQKIHEKTGGMSETVLPNPEEITGKVRTVRLGTYHEHVEAGRCNWKWDGKPERQSHYA
ncbi:hypothetical protein LCGC14_2389160 [marine sediment metagenome]|uniref:Uncharacterized protein n=1 Tax=marine sediment metagenome TaxID=412755 RepID=A0A0F9BYN3_9ZZZZ